MTRATDAGGGASQRALSVREFCRRYGVGRSKTYHEIKAKRLRARKAGNRTIITSDDAEAWLRALPAFGNNHSTKGVRS